MHIRLASFFVAIAVAACATSSIDYKQRVTQNRAAYDRTPGAAQATELAASIWLANDHGDYEKDPAGLEREVSYAVDALAAAVDKSPGDAPLLHAWRGRMLILKKDVDNGVLEMARSHQQQPNEIASMDLVTIYGGLGNQQNVANICKRSLEVFRDADLRVRMIEHCNTNMNAASIEVATSWMSPELKDWYGHELAQREQAHAERQREQAAQDRFENEVRREQQMCGNTCTQKKLKCDQRCYENDIYCRNNCIGIANACIDSCNADAHRKLGE